MRRKDKQITDQNLLLEILQNNTICRVALSDNNTPYIIPMNYGYANNRIYLHSAKEGKKIDIIQRNNSVCFEITDSIEIVESEIACDFGTKYRSVIGFGKIFPVIEKEKKREALEVIMRQHTKKTSWNFNESILDKIIVFEIKIESITGKKSGL